MRRVEAEGADRRRGGARRRSPCRRGDRDGGAKSEETTAIDVHWQPPAKLRH
jgi:hypothetical protein